MHKLLFGNVVLRYKKVYTFWFGYGELFQNFPIVVAAIWGLVLYSIVDFIAQAGRVPQNRVWKLKGLSSKRTHFRFLFSVTWIQTGSQLPRAALLPFEAVWLAHRRGLQHISRQPLSRLCVFVIHWRTISPAAYANNYRKIKGKQNYFRAISRAKAHPGPLLRAPAHAT